MNNLKHLKIPPNYVNDNIFEIFTTMGATRGVQVGARSSITTGFSKKK